MQNEDYPPRDEASTLEQEGSHSDATPSGEDEDSLWERFDDMPTREGDTVGILDPGDVGRVREILEQQLRERPLTTLLACLAAGWLAGKLLR